MLRRFLAKQHGFSLTSMMVGIGIAGIVATGGLQVVESLNRTQKILGDTEVRDSVAQQIRTQIKRREVLDASALYSAEDGNVQLNNCMQIVGADCSVLNPNVQVPFRLLKPTGGTAEFVAGTASQPKYYSATGQSCPDGTTLSSTTCRPAWQATTYFWAGCQAGQVSCKIARALYLRFQVVPVATAIWLRKPKALPPDPEFSYNKSSNAYTYRLGAGLIKGASCPIGSVESGVKADGNPNCLCPSGMVQTGLDGIGNPTCEAVDMQCAVNYQMMGYDSNGAPVCDLIVASVKPPTCKPRGSCLSDEWINEVTVNVCTWSLYVFPKAMDSSDTSHTKLNCGPTPALLFCCKFP